MQEFVNIQFYKAANTFSNTWKIHFLYEIQSTLYYIHILYVLGYIYFDNIILSGLNTPFHSLQDDIYIFFENFTIIAAILNSTITQF